VTGTDLPSRSIALIVTDGSLAALTAEPGCLAPTDAPAGSDTAAIPATVNPASAAVTASVRRVIGPSYLLPSHRSPAEPPDRIIHKTHSFSTFHDLNKYVFRSATAKAG
jgi:hypothetical protein